MDSRQYWWSARLRVASVVAMVALAAGISSPLAGAQVVGANVSGTVVDDSGGALPGATVTITNTANGRQQVLVTGPEGNYRAVALQPGPYEVLAELQGFGSSRREFTLVVGADATVDLRLGVAAVEESVTVTGEAPLVEVTRSAPSSTIVEEQIQALPVLDRNFLALAQLMPGSAPYSGSRFAVVKFGAPADQRNGYTTIIDGGDVDDAIWGNPTINMTQDAVQEFKAFRNQFDAQYGAALSAVVTVVTKSGTNQYHGTGFFFGRDRTLNSRNAKASTKPAYDQQRVGGSFGGPLALNRTHFFSAYEYSNVDTATIVALPASNPFAAEHNGVYPSGNDNHMAHTKVDHRFSDAHSMFVRWAYDDQDVRRGASPTAGTINDYSKSHSISTEENWVLSNNKVNTLRAHVLFHDVGTVPTNFDVNIARPSFTTGQNTTAPQYFPRRRLSLYETLYVNTPRHDIKIGGDFTFASHDSDLHFFEAGQFTFTTDRPFSINDRATWPISFVQQRPTFYTYKSNQIALYVQDDWRVHNRVRVNLGLRYDLDTNLRLNDHFARLVNDPRFAGIENFVQGTGRGNDYNNLQPRLGMAWDTKGDGSFVVRGAWGIYVARNRPWFQMTTLDRTSGLAVRIEDPERLKFFPDINAVLGGQSLEAFLDTGGAKSVFFIDNDTVLPYAYNSSAGFGWQINSFTSLDVDVIHQFATKQLGAEDRNLPATGRISATNPRPVRQFTEVKVMENLTDSWYDAVEAQLRTRVRGMNSLQVSYAFSRAYRDGVNHYQTYRGTMRTPQERGYSETDTRHNISFASSATLPWQFQLSGIVRWISGSPRLVQAGFDIDGDGQTQNDRPAGLPISVGRGNVADQLRIINELRATRNLAPIDADLLKFDPLFNVDVRLTKVLSLPQDRRLEVFIEAYNATNYVRLGGGTSNIVSPAFLIRTSAAEARQIQWGFRYAF